MSSNESLTVQKPQVICVLGAHRSGTSLMARILNLLGVFLGSPENLIGPAPDNEKGFWEYRKFTQLNDAILDALGGKSWDPPPTLQTNWKNLPELADLRTAARALIREDFNVPLWGWKDPRNCLTLPFWQNLLPDIKYVVCLRNPVDAARSLHSRDAIPFERCLELWCTYTARAIANTAGKARLFVFYEDVMEDWRRELDRLASFLQMPNRAEQTEILTAIQDHIETELQHHKTPAIDVIDQPRVPFPAKSLYLFLRLYVNRLARGGATRNADLPPCVVDSFGQCCEQAQGDQDRQRIQRARLEQSIRDFQTLVAEMQTQDARERIVCEDLEQELGTLRLEMTERDKTIQDWQKRFDEQAGRLAQLEERERTLLATKSYRLGRQISETYGTLLNFVRPVKTASDAAPPARPRIVTASQKRWPADLPLVSVVIPCYNYGRFLEDALDSVLRQSFQNLEILVVDDGSTDPETIALLQTLARPKTRILHQRNRGLPAARNAGIRKAQGKYICCLDADDTLEPAYLEKTIALLETNPGIAFAYSWVRLYGDQEGIWRTEPFDLTKLIRYNHVSVAAVFAKSAWKQVGGYCQEMQQGCEDWEFWIHLGAHGFRGQLIPEALFNHRRHGRTMTHSARGKHTQLVSFMAKRHKGLFSHPQSAELVKRKYSDVHVDLPFLNLQTRRDFGPPLAKQSVLILVPWLVTGGAENVLFHMMQGLGTQDFEFFVCSTMPSDNEWHDRFCRLTRHIYHLPNFLPEYAYGDFVLNTLRTRGIQRLLISGAEFGYQILPELRIALPDLQVINLIHNDSEFGYFAHSVDYDPYIDRHIAVQDRIATKLREVGRLCPSKIVTIYNGVDTEAFNPARYGSELSRDRWHLPAGKQVVTFIGRLSAEKRPEQFLELASMFTKRQDTFFVLVGNGPLESAVEQKISRLRLGDGIRWLRGLPPEQIPEILAATDILVLTSATEGSPMVVCEALAMGVPVVAYDVGGLGSMVKNGTNGFVVAPGQLAQLYRKVLELLSSESLLAICKEQARPTLIQSGATLPNMIKQYRKILMEE